MMGYSITYNSGSTTPFGTFKQGTITMGLKPQEYTVSSGFTWYANAETPNDNYLIISDTYSQGWSDQQNSKPTIWRSETGTTESFVSLVNQLPDVNGVTGFTDSGTAMKYLMDSGKYFVNKDDYLGIVSDGLVLNLDAGWYPSYSGSGTTWKDIKGTNNGTLTNGPTFNSANGGSIVFDGVDDYIFVPDVISTGLGFSGTIEVITNVTGNTVMNERENTSSGVGDFGNGYFQINDNYTFRVGVNSKKGIPYTYFITSSLSGNPTQLNHYIASYTIPSTTGIIQGILGVNGVFETVTSTVVVDTTSSNNDNIEIGRHKNHIYSTRYCSPGIIPIVRIYNRRLTQEEMLQNYNAQKGRFGL